MKKLLLMLIISLGATIGANAQTEVKVKKTSTVGQKVHNTFSKHKHHKGYKVKTKVNGRKYKKTVDVRNGKTEVKTN